MSTLDGCHGTREGSTSTRLLACVSPLPYTYSSREQCDQKWPTCERCQRSGLACPGPSNPHAKFVDERPRHYIRSSLSSTSDDEASYPNHAPCTSLEPILTRYETDGAMYSTFRIVREGSSSSEGSPTSESEESSSPELLTRVVQSPPRKARSSPPPRWVCAPRQLPWSPVDRITHRFVKTLREQGASNQMTLFGPFIAQVPTRLGQTKALRDAAQCLIATHEAVILRKSGEGINLELYVKALGSLRAAIIHPVPSELTSTLCASALLAITEAYVRLLFVSHNKVHTDLCRPSAPSGQTATSSRIWAAQPACCRSWALEHSETPNHSSGAFCEPLPSEW